MTSCLSSVQRKMKRKNHKMKLQRLGNHDEFLNRIRKTLYYGKVPLTDRFSLPVTELAAELFSKVKRGYSLERLHTDDAAQVSRNACVSPCSLVLALLYLERLHTSNTEYLQKVSPSELFLVSMMVASKFLHDDGEEDEVFNDEWATSGGIELRDMNRLEREFLNAINWEVYVSEEVFYNRLQAMEAELALRQGSCRGWFSYTELYSLVHAVEFLALAQSFITVSAVCLTSYTVSILAMVGSSIVVNQMPSLASSLVTPSTTVTPTTPPLHPLVTPTPPPTSSCMLNNTVLDEATAQQILLDLEFLEADDTQNDSLPETYRLNTFNDWFKKRNWLSSVTDLARVHHPSMLLPVQIKTH